MIGLDTETLLVSDEHPVPPMVCAALAVDDTAVVLHAADPDTPAMLSEALDSGPLALANAPFDLAVIAEQYPELEPKVWGILRRGDIVDVLTRERLICIATGQSLKREFGLKQIVKRWCHVELDKSSDSPRKSYGDLQHVPLAWWPVDAVTYAEDDVRYTLLSADRQLGYATHFETEHGVPLFADAANQARAHWALHLGSLHGIHTDLPRVEELGGLLEAKQKALFERLQETGLVDRKGVKKQAPLQAMLRELGVTAETASSTPEKPRLKADAETLERLDLPETHPLWAYRAYARCQKMRGTYWQPMRLGMIRGSYTELVSNGRTSMREPNLQNLPKQHLLTELLGIDWGFRECLIPAPGNVFVTADFGKSQLVCWAQVLLNIFGADAPTAALAKALAEGRDIHAELLAEMGGSDRTLAKIGNFSLMGGAGADRLIAEALGKYGMRLKRDDVVRMIDAWKRRWSGGWYFGWIEDQMVDGRMNFVHSSGRVVSGLRFSDACNYPFSGLEADATKDCLWRLAVEMYTEPDSPLYGARQPLFVHDENVLECPAERGEAVAARLVEVMKDAYRTWCPDVPIEVDVKIQERYSK